MSAVIPYAFYGTLMAREGRGHGLLSLDLGSYGERCRVRGKLYNIGRFPGLVKGNGVVHGQLWTPYPEAEVEACALLDNIECYYEYDESRSMYLRRKVRLLEPNTEAWVYYWAGSLDGLERIPEGDWRRFYAQLTEVMALD